MCLSLVRCESEAEVVEILDKEGYWDNPDVWVNFGDTENNYATIGNQQADPENALVEKIINSVDATLMAECLRREIKPEKNPMSPQSMTAAVEQFFGIEEGKLSERSSEFRNKLAEECCNIVATGSRNTPCISIIDKGEGQSPARMPNTLLSLNKSNKLRIPFVQGKFNMGGTGVFRFCSSQHNLQLIISKRHPDVAKHEHDKTNNLWSFTIIRREDPEEDMKSSVYRYLAPNDNHIIAFEGEGLPLLPGKFPLAYDKLLHWGTYIKLFDYQLGTGYRSIITLRLNYRLSFLLPNLSLPVRLWERRKYGGKWAVATLAGLEVRLADDRLRAPDDKRKVLEIDHPFSGVISVQGQQIRYSIYVFKKGRHKNYKEDEGVTFTVNGQTHGALPDSFFTRSKVKLDYIKDSLVVIVDCSDLDKRPREELFANSRDRLANIPLKKEILQELQEELASHEGLKRLQHKREQQEFDKAINVEDILEDALNDIIAQERTFAALFGGQGRISSPISTEGAKAASEFKGREYPTFFNLAKNKNSPNNPKFVPKGEKFRIQYITDAVDDYLSRDINRGTFALSLGDDEDIDYRMRLLNGIGTLSVRLPKNAAIGDLLHYKSELTDLTQIEPFTSELYVKIEKPRPETTSQPGVRKPPASQQRGSESVKKSGGRTPRIEPVKQDRWSEFDFDKESALQIRESEESGLTFSINVDNMYLRRQQEEKKNAIDSATLEFRFEIGLVLVGMGLKRIYERKQQQEEFDHEIDIKAMISEIAKGIAPILIPTIEHCSKLRRPAGAMWGEWSPERESSVDITNGND